uniref:7TM GPCR serpentine receptor class x (Srx) domain-containing protein n=1 Tax=Biomphalaria glabrata TaxID=6526 RepID=A0A2C9L521_BIOGL
MALNISSPVSRTLLSDFATTRDLLSDKDYIIVEGVITVLSVALAFVGVLGNDVSIITFVSMASKDGVTVTFLFTAAADLIYLVTVIAMGVSFLLLSVEVISGYTIWFPVEPYGVYGFLAMSGRYPYEASNLATTCLSVARCLCVAKPLLYRSSFTGNAALCITLIFSVFSIACFTPVLALMEMKVQYSNYINASRPSMWISPTRETVKDVIWTVTDAFIPIATQVIIAFCVVVMNRSLKLASEFRQKSYSGLTRRGKSSKHFAVAHAILMQ